MALMVFGCGVKGDPIAPKDAVVPSLLENYPDIQLERSLDENRKL